MMTKTDIFLLNEINKNEAINSFFSITISDICKNLDLSNTTIRISIKKLISHGLVSEGYMQGNAKTYYITQKGIDLISELDLEEDNEEEYINI